MRAADLRQGSEPSEPTSVAHFARHARLHQGRTGERRVNRSCWSPVPLEPPEPPGQLHAAVGTHACSSPCSRLDAAAKQLGVNSHAFHVAFGRHFVTSADGKGYGAVRDSLNQSWGTLGRVRKHSI